MESYLPKGKKSPVTFQLRRENARDIRGVILNCSHIISYQIKKTLVFFKKILKKI